MTPVEALLQGAIAAGHAVPAILDFARREHPELMTEPFKPLVKSKAARAKARAKLKGPGLAKAR